MELNLVFFNIIIKMHTIELCVLILVFGFRLFSVTFYVILCSVQYLQITRFYCFLFSSNLPCDGQNGNQSNLNNPVVMLLSRDSADRGRSIIRVIVSLARVMEK